MAWSQEEANGLIWIILIIGAAVIFCGGCDMVIQFMATLAGQ